MVSEGAGGRREKPGTMGGEEEKRTKMDEILVVGIDGLLVAPSLPSLPLGLSGLVRFV